MDSVGYSTIELQDAFLAALQTRSKSMSTSMVRKLQIEEGIASVIQEIASVIDRIASVIDGVASVIQEMASVIDGIASVIDGIASALQW